MAQAKLLLVALMSFVLSSKSIPLKCSGAEYVCGNNADRKHDLEGFEFFGSRSPIDTFAIVGSASVTRLVSLLDSSTFSEPTITIQPIFQPSVVRPQHRKIAEQACAHECIVDKECKNGYSCTNYCCEKEAVKPADCIDDELRLLLIHGYTCPELNEALSCDDVLANISPFISPGVALYQLCPRTCDRCEARDLVNTIPRCSDCPDTDKKNRCTVDGTSLETDCQQYLVQCVSDYLLQQNTEDSSILEACNEAIYGIVTDVSSAAITVISVDSTIKDTLCEDASIPYVRCSNEEARRVSTKDLGIGLVTESPDELFWDPTISGERLNGGHSFYNFSAPPQANPAFIRVKSSFSELGPGMLVRLTSAGRNQITSVAILSPRTPQPADLRNRAVAERITVKRVFLHYPDQDPANFYAIIITSDEWAFNVSSDTIMRDFRRMSNGGALSPLDLTEEALADSLLSITYLSASLLGPFPFIGMASQISVFKKVDQSRAEHSCILEGGLYCSDMNTCLSEENAGKCPRAADRCPGSDFIPCGKNCYSQPTADVCSDPTVDIWGKIAEARAVVHCNQISSGVNAIVSNDDCSDGQKKRILQLRLDEGDVNENRAVVSRVPDIIVDRDTLVSGYNGWRYPVDRIGQLVTAGTLVRMEIDTTTEDRKELRLLSLTVIGREKCVDDPGGLFASQGISCRVFLPLGCIYDLSSYSNAVLPGTQVQDLCPETCNQCGGGGTPPDICEEPGLDLCITFLKGGGCPGYLEEWQPTESINCMDYRFCQRIHDEIADLCNPNNHTPEKPCQVARDQATTTAISSYVPQCENDGMTWASTQSYRDGSKFCVDVHTGSRKPGTTTTSANLTCGGNHTLVNSTYCNSRICVSASCPTPTCAINECAERGFDPSDCCVYRCRETLNPIDLSTISPSVADMRPYEKTILRVFYQSGGEPTATQLEDLHNHLTSRVANLDSNRLTLVPLPSALEVDVAPSTEYFDPAVAVNEKTYAEDIQQLEIEQYQVVAGIDHVFDTNVVHQQFGKPLYKVTSREKSIVTVGRKDKLVFEKVADFGEHGKIIFKSEEGKATKINVSLDLSSVSNNQQTVEWGIYPPSKDGRCPIPDQRIWDPTETQRNSLCHQSDKERWIWCRLGDLSGKHGVLPAGRAAEGPEYTRDDWTLPLSGWASAAGQMLVLGLDPPLCAVIGPEMKTQLVAKFNYTLEGSLEFKQTYEGHDTQVSFSMKFHKLALDTMSYDIRIYKGRYYNRGCPSLTEADIFNPYNVDVAQESNCISGQSTNSPFHCKLGDLSRRYGKYTFPVPGTAFITDQYLDTIGPDDALFPRNSSEFKGLHVQIISQTSGEVVDCANLDIYGVDPPLPPSYSDTSDSTSEKMGWVILGLAVVLGLVVICIVIKIALCCTQSDDETSDKKDEAKLVEEAAPDPASTSHMLQSPAGGAVHLKAELATVGDVEVELEMSDMSGSDEPEEKQEEEEDDDPDTPELKDIDYGEDFHDVEQPASLSPPTNPELVVSREE
eukprot:TRINITY_DN3046_c0_g3_i1.p1 TRINITY_DN3046_c0_g3~~TRINITY_DN3046_c0_g3_i1.p1  ORF type:complete len:1514 (+),score=217.40 TRINITY_DN3046_c0_g3_i1:905-5446(+)